MRTVLLKIGEAVNHSMFGPHTTLSLVALPSKRVPHNAFDFVIGFYLQPCRSSVQTSVPAFVYIPRDMASDSASPGEPAHTSLRHSLLGPSLLKAGQDRVDQQKVGEVIYNASKGSKFFKHEERRDEQVCLSYAGK